MNATILDHPFASAAIFHCRPADLEPTFVVETGGVRLHCYRFDRHPDAGWLLHFHGNGELAAEYAAYHADLFLNMGVNVCFAEYRGYGGSTGTPAIAAMLPDSEAVAVALGVPANRLVVYGRSLGSIYAAALAKRWQDIAGLILESGTSSVADTFTRRVGLLDRIGATEAELLAEVREHIDIESIVRQFAGRLLVLHTANDRLLVAEHACRVHEWATTADKRLVLFPRGGHNDLLSANLDDYVREMTDFLARSGCAASA